MPIPHQIRVFCPIHEAAFETGRSSTILCEITGHTLASEFPASEIWEFCCNCSTFSPTKLDKGQNARTSCFSCHNEIATRTLCPTCMTVAFAGKARSKGQSYFIDECGVTPSCPGCGEENNQKHVRHQCDEISAALFTSLEACPFCLEGTSVGFVLPYLHPEQGNICSRCHSANPETAAFCGTCRTALNADVRVDNIGSDVPRTAVGSLCPNCSYPMPADADFCGECGQAVKRRMSPAAPPPPPVPTAGQNGKVLPTLSSTAPTPSAGVAMSPTLLISLVIGGLFIVIIAAIAMTQSSTTNTSNGSPASNNANRPYGNSYNAAANAMNPARNAMNVAANTVANAANSTVANPSSNSPSNTMIGRHATLTWDAPIRDYADKDLQPAGFHFRGAKVHIIDVDNNVLNDDGGTSRWYKVEVVSYGSSIDPGNAGLSKNYGTPDVGWIPERRDVWTGPKRTKLERKRRIFIFDR